MGLTECRRKIGVVYLVGVMGTRAHVHVYWMMCKVAMKICGFGRLLHVVLCLCCKAVMEICGFGAPLHVVLCLHCQYSGLSGCAPVLQGDDGDMRP